LQKYPSSDIKFNLNSIEIFIHKTLFNKVSVENYNLIKDMYAYFSCIQEYCVFINKYNRYPQILSEFWSYSDKYPSISLEDGKIIWGENIFFLALFQQFPSKLTDILNEKIITKTPLKNINLSTSELKFNNITSEELNYVFHFFPNLKQLYIANSNLDFSIIKLPTTLNTLLINRSVIENFEQCKCELFYLSLSRCNLKNKTNISNFKKLNTLILNYTNLENIYGLRNLTELVRFEAQNTKFKDLNLLSEAHLLKVLIINNTNLDDLSHINYFSALEHLNVANCKIKTLGTIELLHKLKYLNIKNTNISQIEIMQLKEKYPDMIILYTH
jgi:hypothetical protein